MAITCKAMRTPTRHSVIHQEQPCGPDGVDAGEGMNLINQPLLMIAGSIADTFYMTELCYSRATGTQQKELFLIPGATHIQTYHVPEYVNQAVNKLTEFFSKNL